MWAEKKNETPTHYFFQPKQSRHMELATETHASVLFTFILTFIYPEVLKWLCLPQVSALSRVNKTLRKLLWKNPDVFKFMQKKLFPFFYVKEDAKTKRWEMFYRQFSTDVEPPRPFAKRVFSTKCECPLNAQF